MRVLIVAAGLLASVVGSAVAASAPAEWTPQMKLNLLAPLAPDNVDNLASAFAGPSLYLVGSSNDAGYAIYQGSRR